MMNVVADYKGLANLMGWDPGVPGSDTTTWHVVCLVSTPRSGENHFALLYDEKQRGKLVVIVERWHMRYSDTPGGGWEVIEWLRGRGEVTVQSVADQWRVVFDDGHPNHGRLSVAAPTMAEAACLIALRLPSANAELRNGHNEHQKTL